MLYESRPETTLKNAVRGSNQKPHNALRALPNEAVALEGKLIEVGQLAYLLGYGAAQPVFSEIQVCETGEVTQLSGYDSTQPVVSQRQGLQTGQVAQFTWNFADQPVASQFKTEELAEIAQFLGHHSGPVGYAARADIAVCANFPVGWESVQTGG